MRPPRAVLFISLFAAAVLTGGLAWADAGNTERGILDPIAPGYKITSMVAYAYSGAIRPNTSRGSTRTLEEDGLPIPEVQIAAVQKRLADLFVICITSAPRPTDGAGFSLPDPENAIFMRRIADPKTSRIFLDGTATYQTINGSTLGHFMCILEGKRPAFWYFVPNY